MLNEKSKKVFVTGATGFIGGNFVRRLTDAGHKVKALVRRGSNISHLRKLSNVELIVGDITDGAAYRNDLENVDIIYNMAGVVTDWASAEAYYNVHVLGLKNLLDAAVANRVPRFIHISTVAVLEKNMKDIPLNDVTTPFTKSDIPYDRTKLVGEKLALQYALDKKIEVVVFRPGWVYGVGDTTLFPEIAYQCKKGAMVLVHNDHVLAPLIHVENLCDVLLLAMTKNNINGETFLLSDGEITWKDLCDQIAVATQGKKPKLIIPYKLAYLLGFTMELVGKMLKLKNRPLLTRTAAEMIGVGIIIDTSKAKKMLNYTPRISLQSGIKEVLDWLAKSNLEEIRLK